MTGLAKVSVQTGVTFLPIETPYDRDVLFEYLNSVATAHEQVQVELDGLRVLVGATSAPCLPCARCDRDMPESARRYVIDERPLCTRCVRTVVSSSRRVAGATGWLERVADRRREARDR